MGDMRGDMRFVFYGKDSQDLDEGFIIPLTRVLWDYSFWVEEFLHGLFSEKGGSYESYIYLLLIQGDRIYIYEPEEIKGASYRMPFKKCRELFHAAAERLFMGENLREFLSSGLLKLSDLDRSILEILESWLRRLLPGGGFIIDGASGNREIELIYREVPLLSDSAVVDQALEFLVNLVIDAILREFDGIDFGYGEFAFRANHLEVDFDCVESWVFLESYHYDVIQRGGNCQSCVLDLAL